ncbi:GumC family protein [Mariniphaga sp.]|uniref:GumC family protein n=1 Tax=Mariniphaga sp. TaxID=1954475 RepID=UPI0035648D40
MNHSTLQEQNNKDIQKIVSLLFRNSWIILLCIIIALAMAYAYNNYALPTYKVSATLLLKDQSERNISRDETSYINSDLLVRNQNLQNELEILKSNPIIEQAVEKLNLEVSYYEYKNYQYHNAYKKVPFKVFIFKEHQQLVGPVFDIHLNSDGSYSLKVEKQDGMVYNYTTGQIIRAKEGLDLDIKGNLGQIVETEDFKFLITINDNDSLLLQNNIFYAFRLSTNKQIVSQMKGRLEYNIPNELATIVEISMEVNSVQLGIDIINELIQVYSESNLEKKNHLANMTLEYIEGQLDEISASLNLTENNLQQFMSQNKMMNVDEQSTRLSQQRLDLQNQLAELMTQKRYYEYIKEYNANSSDEVQIIPPSAMGVQDPLLNNLIRELSTAQAQKANMINNNQERNPIVNRLNIQINNLKKTIAENIAAAARSNEISINEMQNRIAQIENEISNLPKTQMQMGGIQRNYDLNNSIYNYLLQKQAEAKITKASNLPDNMIMEPAHLSSSVPVFPNKMRNYILALFLGIGIPTGILLLLNLFKTTITTQEDIENITNAAVIGKIFHYNNQKEKNVFISSPESKTAETFRTLRTNLNFALNGSLHKTILVTSCISGEGKSFSALNIASSYAQMGKKTVLLDFDLRNSKSVIKNKNKTVGLSLFLNEELTLNEIIQKTDFKNLDIIHSGPVPPDPLDLMEKEIVADLFKFLRENYDYIIIDTPPLAQVSDALTIIEYSNLSLIVTRYNVTKKKLLRLVLKELKNKNIKNVNLLINDNKLVSEQMGYGYYQK